MSRYVKGAASAYRGEKSPRAKLTKQQVLVIIRGRQSPTSLGALLGVSPNTITNIRAGRRWRWLHKKLRSAAMEKADE